jgi:hypothetical protein
VRIRHRRLRNVSAGHPFRREPYGVRLAAKGKGVGRCPRRKQSSASHGQRLLSRRIIIPVRTAIIAADSYSREVRQLERSSASG